MLAGFLPPSAAAPGTAKITDLGCIAAFHHSVNSAWCASPCSKHYCLAF